MRMEHAEFDEELRQILVEHEQNPTNVELAAKLCYELNIRSYHQFCIDIARSALVHEPHHANLYFELIIASSLDTAHILEEILEALTAIIAARPGDSGARRNLALVHFFLESDAEADEVLQELLAEQDPEQTDRQTFEVLAQVAYARADYQECLRLCDLAINKPGPSARMIRLKGLCFQELGEPAKAMDAFRQALDLEPFFVWACHSLGSRYLESGNFANALRYFGLASYINPRDPGNLFLLAEGFMEMEEDELASAELIKLLRCKPPTRIEAEVCNALGFLDIRNDRLSQAKTHLDQAIELEPELAVAYYNLGQLAEREGNANLAERQYKTALAIDPLYLECHLELGILYLEAEKLEAAERHFRAAEELDEEEPQVQLGFSKLSQKRKDHQKQLEYAQRAFDLDSENAEIGNNLGIALECAGMLQDAELAYRHALDLDPLHAAAANNLGHLLEKMMVKYPNEGDRLRKEAIAAWKKRLEICIKLDKSIKAAVTHLGQLGLSAKELTDLENKLRADQD